MASLDAWRGLAALLVVAIHATMPALTGPYPELRTDIPYRFIGYGIYGVQVFFVLSGLCVAQAAVRVSQGPSPFLTFVAARVRRIYPPYAIASLLAVVLSALGAFLVTHNVLPNSSIGSEALFARPSFDYACSALLMQRVCDIKPLLPVFWTLSYEAAFYTLTAVAMLGAHILRGELAVLNICHGLTLTCCVVSLLVPGVLWYPFDLWPEFGLGILVFDVIAFKRRVAYGGLIATSVMLCMFAATRFGGGGQFTSTPGLATSVALAFSFLLIVVYPFDDKLVRLLPIRLLCSVGVFSYSLYLVHWMVVGPVSQVMKMLHLITASNYWISALAQIGASVVIGRLFYMMAERPFLVKRPARVVLEKTGIASASSLSQVS